MKLYKLLKETEIQSEYKVVYFDEDKFERIEIKDTFTEDSIYYNAEILYIYVEEDILFIEIEKESN